MGGNRRGETALSRRGGAVIVGAIADLVRAWLARGDFVATAGFRRWCAWRRRVAGERDAASIVGCQIDTDATLYAQQAAFALACHAMAARAVGGEIDVLETAAAPSLGGRLVVSPVHPLFVELWPSAPRLARALIASTADAARVNGDSVAARSSELYEALFPPRARRALGEFHTPYPLAAFLVGVLADQVDLDRGVACDPACGSGIFLEAILRHRRRQGAAGGVGLLAGILGLEANPPALVAAWATLATLVADDLPAMPASPLRLPLHWLDIFDLTDRSTTSETLASALPVDLVVGNPAWLNWEDLPTSQRHRLRELIGTYGLVAERSRVGATKIDTAGLSLAIAADRLLGDDGTLAFLVPQSLLRAGANTGLRHFSLPDGTPLAPTTLHDFAGLQMFRGASNRAAWLTIRKGRAAEYPIATTTWRASHGARRQSGHQVAELLARLRPEAASSIPLGAGVGAPWVTIPAALLDTLERFITRDGSAPQLETRLGVNTGGASSFYWGEVRRSDKNRLEFRNACHAGRIPSPQLPWLPVEREHLFPLLKGRDLKRWSTRPSERVILVPHDRVSGMRAIDEPTLRRDRPDLWALLSRPEARARLEKRRALRRWGGKGGTAWYGLFEIGPYTFSPYKVAFPGQVALELTVCLLAEQTHPVLGRCLALPDQTVSFIPRADRASAAFTCGLLGSSFVRLLYRCFNYKHPGTFFVRSLRLPRFDSADASHLHLVDLVTDLMSVAGEDDRGDRQAALEWELDRSLAALYELPSSAVETVRATLAARDGRSKAE